MFSLFSSSIWLGFRLRKYGTFIALCAALMLLCAGCSLPWQHSSVAATGEHVPTTTQLFAALQKNFRAVSSFHVVMQEDNPGPASASEVQIRAANGDVVMPDKIKVQATIILSGESVTVNLISIGSSQFITDPITGQWRVVKGVLDPSVLTDPNTGLISLASKVQHPTAPSSDTVNGVPCWLVSGQLDAKYIAFLTGGGVPAGTMLTTTICAGKSDSLPYEIKVTGIAAVGDSADTARIFLISNYNQPVSITAPTL